MDNVPEWLPLVIPLILLELVLKGLALADLIRRGRAKDQKWIWVPVILLVNFVGPMLYLTLGRGE